jgi:hypothetical protein
MAIVIGTIFVCVFYLDLAYEFGPLSPGSIMSLRTETKMKIVCYEHKHVTFSDFRRKDRDPGAERNKPVLILCTTLLYDVTTRKQHLRFTTMYNPESLYKRMEVYKKIKINIIVSYRSMLHEKGSEQRCSNVWPNGAVSLFL